MLLTETAQRREGEETLEEVTFGQDLKNELWLTGQGGEEREIAIGRRYSLIGLHSLFFPVSLDFPLSFICLEDFLLIGGNSQH